MKIPLKWLEEYVPLTLPVAELAERLTLAGLEVSGVRLIGVPPPEGLRVKSAEAGPVWQRDKIVIARVEKIEPHPDPVVVNLKLPTVTYGEGRSKQLVTGATNLKVGEAGQKVVLALTGSVLFNHHAKSSEKVLQELKPAKIRGIPSDAMVCSTFELGIDDDKEAGIILLEEDAPVGMPLVDFMGDVVLELEVTPNLARCLSLIGVAREVAALTGQSLRLPPHQAKAEAPAVEKQVSVSIEDPKLCAPLRRDAAEGRTHRPLAGLDAAAIELRRDAAHQQHRRHHELCAAGVGPTAARLRLRQIARPRQRQDAAHHRPLRPIRRNAGDPRRRE